MVENNKCNTEQYEEIAKHISALLWLNDNGGWESVSKRLMPEGYEWPRFEDDTPVTFGDKWNHNGRLQPVQGIAFRPNEETGNVEAALMAKADIEWKSDGERFKRAELKVLDADGVPIEVGDTVWNIHTGKRYKVKELPKPDGYCSVVVTNFDGATIGFDPDRLSHEELILDANGDRIKVGHTIHVINQSFANDDEPFVVTDIIFDYTGSACVFIKSLVDNRRSFNLLASSTVHKKPVRGADGQLIKVGEIVYGISDGKEWHVVEVTSGSHPVSAWCGDSYKELKAEWLTHEKVDTIEAIKQDIEKAGSVSGYCKYVLGMTAKEIVSRDLISLTSMVLEDVIRRTVDACAKK